MGGTARRLVLSFVLATAVYALPVAESIAAPEVTADSTRDWQPRRLASGEIWGATYTPDGTHVIVSEAGLLTAYPVAGDAGVTLGSGSIAAALQHSPILLIRDAGALYRVEVATGGRELLATDVEHTVLVTDDDRWAIANAGEQIVKIEIAHGTVEPLPAIPQVPSHPGGVPALDTVLNDVMYMAPGTEDQFEVRALNLDSGIDRSVGMARTGGGRDELPSMSVASQPRLVVFGFDGGRTAGIRIYSIEPWDLLHQGSYSSFHLTADGTTLFGTYGSPSGTDTYAVDLETDETVHFGRYLDGGTTGAGLQVAGDDRFASASISDDNELHTEAYVYDVAGRRALSLGELTATVSSRGDAFLGAEPRTLINYHDARSFEPIGTFSVTVTGADPRPWPAHVTRDQSFSWVTAHSVGDKAYALGDIGLYRLNADGSDAVLVAGPLADGERFSWPELVVSPSGDSLVYRTETDTDSNVWLLRIAPEFDPCSGSGVIMGTAGNDEIIGTDADDVISGLGGNDIIDGRGGNDYICGGDGDDRLIGGDGDDAIFGGAGADVGLGGRGQDVIQGGPGPDELVGGRGRDLIYGGDGADSIRGHGGPDRLYGEAGDDQISGGGGADTILGGTGADTLAGNAGPDDISSVAGDNFINGGPGRDTLRGGSGNDVINGAAGNDSLSTTLGSDVLDGGAGDDTIRLGSKGPRGIGGPGNDTITWGGGYWVDPPMIWGGTGNDTIGTPRSTACDVVRGGLGDDTIYCGNGGRLIGGDGADKLRGGLHQYGGRGNDELSMPGSSSGEPERTQHGGPGHDSISGGAARQHGGPGADYMTGDLFTTVQVGGTGDDILKSAMTQYGKKGNDNLSNFDTGYGGHGADTLHGDYRANVLYGGAGDDLLFGNGGDDQLFGGPGIDTLDGGDGNDTCTDEGVTTPC